MEGVRHLWRLTGNEAGEPAGLLITWSPVTLCVCVCVCDALIAPLCVWWALSMEAGCSLMRALRWFIIHPTNSLRWSINTTHTHPSSSPCSSLLPVCSGVSPAWPLHAGVNVNTPRSVAPALCLLEHFHANNQLLFTRDAARVLWARRCASTNYAALVLH